MSACNPVRQRIMKREPPLVTVLSRRRTKESRYATFCLADVESFGGHRQKSRQATTTNSTDASPWNGSPRMEEEVAALRNRRRLFNKRLRPDSNNFDRSSQNNSSKKIGYEFR